MSDENKKDFNSMLNDSKDMPKFQTICFAKFEKQVIYFYLKSLFFKHYLHLNHCTRTDSY